MTNHVNSRKRECVCLSPLIQKGDEGWEERVGEGGGRGHKGRGREGSGARLNLICRGLAWSRHRAGPEHVHTGQSWEAAVTKPTPHHGHTAGSGAGGGGESSLPRPPALPSNTPPPSSSKPRDCPHPPPPTHTHTHTHTHTSSLTSPCTAV